MHDSLCKLLITLRSNSDVLRVKNKKGDFYDSKIFAVSYGCRHAFGILFLHPGE